jgi:alkylation response protein AidB-like acyl-CoA dehydrogenase
VRDGDDYVINGSKTYITNGHRADLIVLLTRTGPDAGHGSLTLFLVPLDAPGVTRERKLVKLGMHASDTAVLSFQDVRVPATAILGATGQGFQEIMWELQGERLISAAGCVAAAERCFERTLAFAKERKAFGREIGHHQATRHKFAEMATRIETARQVVYTAAWRFERGDYPVREISMAKLHAARIAVEVADDCIQIHGGAGYMREYGVERVWRDLRLYRIGAGTDEIMLEVIGRSYGL